MLLLLRDKNKYIRTIFTQMYLLRSSKNKYRNNLKNKQRKKSLIKTLRWLKLLNLFNLRSKLRNWVLFCQISQLIFLMNTST